MNGVRNRLAVGALWTTGGRAASNLLGLLSTLTLARLLTPDDFGLVAFANVIYAVLLATTELSLSSALIQHQDPDDEHYNTAFTLGLIRGLAIAGALVVAATPIASAYGDPRLREVCMMLGVAAILTGLVSPRIVIYRRALSFSQEILTDVVTKLIGLLVAVAIAVTLRSFWAIVAGLLASQMTSVGMSYILAPYRPRLALTRWRSLFSFSSWIALSSGINAINWRADQLALGATLGNGPLGQYTVGDNFASLPVRETTAPIANILFPAFSRMQDEPQRLSEAFLRSQRLLVAMALPVGVGFALVAGTFVELVLGPQWTDAALVAQVLSSVFAVHAFSMPVNPLLMGLGKTRLMFIRDLVNIAIRYPLIFTGLLSGGLLGLLIARCFSGVAGILIDMWLGRRLVGVGVFRQFELNWRAVAATVLMAKCVWLTGHVVDASTLLRLSVMIFSGIISYVGITFTLWLATGRPLGPEHEAMELVRLLRLKMLRRD